MLMDQNTVRVIFGLKLKGLRQKRSMSLKDLAKHTGLSVSYINEIEKGKKYPKPDKVLGLAQALETEFDKLVSVRMDDDQDALMRLLQSGIMQTIPFDDFGINPSEILNMVMEDTEKASLLVSSLLELGRRHFLRKEDFYAAILKSKIDKNRAYFEELESKAKEIRTTFLNDSEPSRKSIEELLSKEFNYRCKAIAFSEESSALQLLSFRRKSTKDGIVFQYNSQLTQKEQLYLLLRELSYCALDISERPNSNADHSFGNFEDYQNAFFAQYLTDAISMPEANFIQSYCEFAEKDRWSLARFRQFLNNWPVPTKRIFHRMGQLLPRTFNIEPLYVLEFSRNIVLDRYLIEEELHLAGLRLPNGINREESFCRRWASMRSLEAYTDKKESSGPYIYAQRSQIHGTDGNFFNIAVAERDSLRRERIVCQTIGLPTDSKYIQKFGFLGDGQVFSDTVSETCERCPIDDCRERLTAPLTIPNPWVH